MRNYKPQQSLFPLDNIVIKTESESDFFTQNEPILPEPRVGNDPFPSGFFSRKKLIISGSVLELSHFSNDYAVGMKRIKHDKTDNQEYPKISLSHEQLREKAFIRARAKIQRLINSNVFSYKKDKGKNKGQPYPPVFFTSTFGENMTDIVKANYEFTKFIKRLNYEFGYDKATLKYVTVIEFQDKRAKKYNQKATIHYHTVFFNLPYRDNRVFTKIWGQGRIDNVVAYNLKGVANYFTKYMIKDLDDTRLQGSKSYFTSVALL